MKKLLSPEIFVGEEKILIIRGSRVILDKDLAALYGVKPIALRQQVKRNNDRFPPDFMFQLTKQESELLVSQFVIPSMRSFGGSYPLAFTQEGAASLSGVLNSSQAVMANIAIMRAFVRMRTTLSANREQLQKLLEIEAKVIRHDRQLREVFDTIRNLMELPLINVKKRKIGFR